MTLNDTSSNRTVHDLKSLKAYFEPARLGIKTFEVRRNDRNFQAGDQIILREVVENPQVGLFEPPTLPTGRWLTGRITYVLDYMQRPGYVVFSFELNGEQK